jgi:hypothetical protein
VESPATNSGHGSVGAHPPGCGTLALVTAELIIIGRRVGS